MKLTMWLKERELNARRLAAGKTGEERAGWIEDADLFQAALAAAEERDRLRAALLVAVRQNEHDMLMTGDELRACRAALPGIGA